MTETTKAHPLPSPPHHCSYPCGRQDRQWHRDKEALAQEPATLASSAYCLDSVLSSLCGTWSSWCQGPCQLCWLYFLLFQEL